MIERDAVSDVREPAAEHGRQHAPFELPARERRVAALRMERLGIHRPLELGVEEHEIRLRARLHGHLRQAEHAPRRLGPQLERARQAQVAGLHQVRERERERGLEADDAERRVGERPRLLVGRVRRVVGGEAVDGAVGDRGDARRAVAFGAERRVHLGVRVVVADRLVREHPVVRTRLPRHPEAATLCVAEGFERRAC